MIATILTPYVVCTEGSFEYNGNLFHQLFPENYCVNIGDKESLPVLGGFPSVNMCVVEAQVTGAQLAQIKSDNRFFVLDPGPGNNGNALLNWLDSKGAQGHGVTENCPPETCIRKLREYCRGL